MSVELSRKYRYHVTLIIERVEMVGDEEMNYNEQDATPLVKCDDIFEATAKADLALRLLQERAEDFTELLPLGEHDAN